ncbi:MAG: hypothetical protein IKX28_08110 [Bacteroidales bacterium]|nr:hypothetical protein [Bacteroidales bacterium]
MDKKGSLSIDHLPEPFYGDMQSCSIVIINLNPGTGLNDQCWSKQDQQGLFVNDVKNQGYSKYAKGFPLLMGKGPVDSVNWWKPRFAWINRILKHKGLDKTDKKPFAIELVPLHSESFNVSSAPKYVSNVRHNYPQIDIINAIEYAIQHSDAQMGLAIGKPICEVLIKNGFTPVYGDLRNPIQPDPNKKRFYCVIENSTSRSRILCTWSYGSNQPPADMYNYNVFESDTLNVYFK